VLFAALAKRAKIQLTKKISGGFGDSSVATSADRRRAYSNPGDPTLNRSQKLVLA
jgi:hypothetical protein